MAIAFCEVAGGKAALRKRPPSWPNVSLLVCTEVKPNCVTPVFCSSLLSMVKVLILEPVLL